MFDSEDGSQLVDEAPALTSLYEGRVWTALGVGPALQLAISSWVNFRCVILYVAW